MRSVLIFCAGMNLGCVIFMAIQGSLGMVLFNLAAGVLCLGVASLSPFRPAAKSPQLLPWEDRYDGF
jgi:hypothetical protein